MVPLGAEENKPENNVREQDPEASMRWVEKFGSFEVELLELEVSPISWHSSAFMPIAIAILPYLLLLTSTL